MTCLLNPSQSLSSFFCQCRCCKGYHYWLQGIACHIGMHLLKSSGLYFSLNQLYFSLNQQVVWIKVQVPRTLRETLQSYLLIYCTNQENLSVWRPQDKDESFKSHCRAFCPLLLSQGLGTQERVGRIRGAGGTHSWGKYIKDWSQGAASGLLLFYSCTFWFKNHTGQQLITIAVQSGTLISVVLIPFFLSSTLPSISVF